MSGRTPYELFGDEGVSKSGWRKLVKPLIEACQKENVAILQIKEKYGTLRFYVGGASDHIFRLIEKAEEKSAETCYDCGEPGYLQSHEGNPFGWYSTLCEKCGLEKGHEAVKYEAEEDV